MTAAFEITIRPFAPQTDAATVRAWLADPHAAFWGMADLTEAQVGDYLRAVADHPHQNGWLGSVDGRPAFYAETYDPAHVLLPGIHDAAPGDLGMHVLIAPPGQNGVHGFTDAVFAAVMRWCFEQLAAVRVVVEPDERNGAIRVKNRRAGFDELRQVTVDDGGHRKTAMLSVCTADAFARSPLAAAVPAPSVNRGVLA